MKNKKIFIKSATLNLNLSIKSCEKRITFRKLMSLGFPKELAL